MTPEMRLSIAAGERDDKGMKKGQLHIHIMFKLKHKSKIQLNYEKIKDKIKKDLGLENIYLYNRLIRNSGSDNILDYINKYTQNI
jgi:hypothetical protein